MDNSIRGVDNSLPGVGSPPRTQVATPVPVATPVTPPAPAVLQADWAAPTLDKQFGQPTVLGDEPSPLQPFTPENGEHQTPRVMQPPETQETAAAQSDGSPAAIAAAARRSAEALWRVHGGYSTVPEARIEGREMDIGYQGYNDDAARLMLANGPAVAQALAALPPARKAEYEELAASIARLPRAGLSLQLLLLEGKLAAGPRDLRPTESSAGDLLANLHAMITQPLMPPLVRDSLISVVAMELATPGLISQKNRGTCAATSTQIRLAIANPAEYARLISGLATPDGTVTMASGETLTRNPGTEAEDGSRRSSSSRLMQAAFMSYAAGSTGYINTAADGRDQQGDGTHGLYQSQVAHLLAGTVGPLYTDTIYGGAIPGTNQYDRAAQMHTLRVALQENLPAMTGLSWGEPDAQGVIHSAHEVLVTKIENGRVYYNNPWGQRESMAEADFQARLLDFSVAIR